jgi:hypothetical protein
MSSSFNHLDPGCCGCNTGGCPGTPLTVGVSGCNSLGVVNATVQLLQGVTVISSGTTNSSGQVSLGGYSSGSSYTISVTPPGSSPWWDSTAVTHSFTPSNCNNTSVGLVLVPATGYSCKCTHCRDPLPDTVTISDSNGTYTATYGSWIIVGGSSGTGWVACYSLAGQNVYNEPGLTCVAAGTGSVPIWYVLQCPGGTNKFSVTELWVSCGVFTPLQFEKSANPCSSGGGFTIGGGPDLAAATQSVNVAHATATAPNNCNDSLSFSMTGAAVNGTVAVSFP